MSQKQNLPSKIRACMCVKKGMHDFPSIYFDWKLFTLRWNFITSEFLKFSSREVSIIHSIDVYPSLVFRESERLARGFYNREN